MTRSMSERGRDGLVADEGVVLAAYVLSIDQPC